MADCDRLNFDKYTVFMKIIGHVRHFRWIYPNVWWEISQIWIEYIEPIRQNVWWTMKVFLATLNTNSQSHDFVYPNCIISQWHNTLRKHFSFFWIRIFIKYLSTVWSHSIPCMWIDTETSCMLELLNPQQAKPGVNTLRPRQYGRHFPDDTSKRIFLNENVRISIKISLKFVPKGPINKIPALVQIMAWCRPGDKPLSEPM